MQTANPILDLLSAALPGVDLADVARAYAAVAPHLKAPKRARKASEPTAAIGCLMMAERPKPSRARETVATYGSNYAAPFLSGECMHMTIKISPNDKGNPPGKLADVELHFTDGPLAGLKLIGFAIWERRGGNGRNVTFPARQYSVNGERRVFALLRPASDMESPDRQLRTLILDAFDDFETRAQQSTPVA